MARRYDSLRSALLREARGGDGDESGGVAPSTRAGLATVAEEDALAAPSEHDALGALEPTAEAEDEAVAAWSTALVVHTGVEQPQPPAEPPRALPPLRSGGSAAPSPDVHSA